MEIILTVPISLEPLPPYSLSRLVSAHGQLQLVPFVGELVFEMLYHVVLPRQLLVEAGDVFC